MVTKTWRQEIQEFVYKVVKLSRHLKYVTMIPALYVTRCGKNQHIANSTKIESLLDLASVISELQVC